MKKLIKRLEEINERYNVSLEVGYKVFKKDDKFIIFIEDVENEIKLITPLCNIELESVTEDFANEIKVLNYLKLFNQYELMINEQQG